MIIICIILGILLTVFIIIHVSYRRQVFGLCRQVTFLNEKQTRLEVTSDIKAGELQELADQIEILNGKYKEIRSRYKNNNESLREMIANISHDIRTPLTSLDGYFQLLADPNTDNESRTKYTGIVKNRIESLKDMLEELFTYTKLSGTEYVLDMTETDITELTAETLMSFYDEFTKLGIEPKVEIPEDSLFINGNREALRRIEQNIMKNAYIHGTSLSVKLFQENGKAVFECSDVFIGNIADIDVNRIFDRFYKADSNRNSKGSGLGLAISKELTERHGGTISASTEDNLFTIRVELPCKQQAVNGND